jgi:hypothetical protein
MENYIIVPITFAEARKNISEIVGVPEEVVDLDIDYVTKIYTQFSLKNSEEISSIADNKDRIGEYYRFENKNIEDT